MMSGNYALSAWIFTRALALVYLIAFLSLSVQARGLWGGNGVAPINSYLERVQSQLGISRYFELPSVFWISAADGMLTFVAVFGALCALAAFAGFAQGWMLLMCFLLYLSFTTCGQDFMSFQWDALLLEVGFLALFAVPWNFKWQWSITHEPHFTVRMMFWVVLFKLMFLSGVVKLLSGDLSWRNLTALTYHYWTQPLPNPLSPFVHALPAWIHKVSTAATFFIELILPFAIFWERTRLWAAAGFVGLSVLILLTGNYTFFNWLTIAICIWLIPDSFWQKVLPERWAPEVLEPFGASPITYGVMGLLALMSLVWCTRWLYPQWLMAPAIHVMRLAQMFHVSSPYGLFANMTKSRPEIVIQGSIDGVEWRDYEFKYKPGGLYRRPPIVAPHQPRLDWQMWFAALGHFRQNPWLQMLMWRLLEGRPQVLSFFAWNPFPEGPPRYVRAQLYEYEFTSPGEILRTGQWWRRRWVRDYSPAFQKP